MNDDIYISTIDNGYLVRGYSNGGHRIERYYPNIEAVRDGLLDIVAEVSAVIDEVPF